MLRQKEDEIRSLEGEKLKPKIKATSTQDLNPAPKKEHRKKAKNEEIEVDESVNLDVPKDAKFIGKRQIVNQDLQIQPRNIGFSIHRYWSVELGRVIKGEIPPDFKGHQFGPVLRTFVLYQYYKNRVTYQKIQKNLAEWGIVISAGTIKAILNEVGTEFAEDVDSPRCAAFKKCPQAHIDETGAKFNGQNYYTFSANNRFYAQYTTSPERNRWSSVAAILGGAQSSSSTMSR
jgi:hypothetical protein